jgi:hypothetical protein
VGASYWWRRKRQPARTPRHREKRAFDIKLVVRQCLRNLRARQHGLR